MPDEGATTGTTHDARLHASERAGRQLLRSCPGTSSESACAGCCSSTGAAVTCARANARSLLSWTNSASRFAAAPWDDPEVGDPSGPEDAVLALVARRHAGIIGPRPGRHCRGARVLRAILLE